MVFFLTGNIILHHFRYGGFSLGASATQALPQIHHVHDSVTAVRARYRVPQVQTRFDAIKIIVSLNVLSFFLNHVTEQFAGCSAEETAEFPRKTEQSKQRQGTCI